MTLFTRKGDHGVFDKLFSWMDELRSNGKYPYGLEQLVYAIEGTVQDLNDEDIENEIKTKLGFWFQIARTNMDSEVLDSFQVYAFELLKVLSFWRQSDKQSILREISSIGVAPPDGWELPSDGEETVTFAVETVTAFKTIKLEKGTALELRNLVGVVDQISTSNEGLSDKLTAFFRTHSDAISIRELVESKSESKQIYRVENRERNEILSHARSTWSIDIRFLGENIPAANVGRSLWAISSALESIDGVAVAIVDWKKGSLLARMRVWVRNIWAKDEVREVLERGREAAVAHYLDKPSEEAKKVKAEREKIQEEKKLLEQQIASGASDLARRSLELEIEVKEQELRSRKLDNSLKTLAVMEKASELLKDGIISADKVQIEINELAYLLIEDSRIVNGESLKKIEAHENLLRPDQIPPAEQSDE